MTRRAAIALLLLALGACTNENASGRVTYALYDCDISAKSDCASAPADQPTVASVISSEASRYQPDGVYVLAQSVRSNGVTAIFELDVAQGQTALASYSEWSHGQRVFNGTPAGGKVLMSSASRTRGRFALRFVDPGPDGVCGTSDDLFRFLANGQYYLSSQSAAKPATDPTLGVQDESDDQIDLVDVIIDATSDDWTTSDGTTDDSTVDVSPSTDTTDDSGGGCGGDSGGDPSSSDSSTGCGGDTGGGSADTSGCSGDTGGDSLDLSGCGGCSGDLQPSPAAKKHAAHARGDARFFPVFAFAFAQVLRRPRSKSRSAH